MVAKQWESWEDEIVRSHRGSCRELQAKLAHRTLDAVKWRRKALGVRREDRLPWTGCELKTLRAAYASGGVSAACSAFPNRSKNALRHQAQIYQMHDPSRKKVSRASKCPPVIADIRAEIAKRGIALAVAAKQFGFRRHLLKPSSVARNGVSHAAVDRIARQLEGELYVEWED